MEERFNHENEPVESQTATSVSPSAPSSLATLPRSTEALVLGILSIVTCCCYGLFGLVSGVIGLILGNKAIATYNLYPGSYSTESLANAKAGKVCAIVGIVFSILCIVFIAVFKALASEVEEIVEQVIKNAEMP